MIIFEAVQFKKNVIVIMVRQDETHTQLSQSGQIPRKSLFKMTSLPFLLLLGVWPNLVNTAGTEAGHMLRQPCLYSSMRAKRELSECLPLLPHAK